MIKTAVIGASGYIGGHLFNKYRTVHSDCIGTGYARVRDGMIAFDLRNPDSSLLNLEETGHEAIVISSAMPLVGWCEANPKESYELNVTGTLKFISQLAKSPIHVIFLSTDYVFDGKDGGYTDKSRTCPITQYGKQKAEVERELPNITNNYTIARLSKIYGTSWNDKTIIDDIAKSLIEGKSIKVATDQFFTPTHVDDVVSMILHIQENNIKGLVNLCCTSQYSRHQIAVKLADALNISKDLMQCVLLHSIPGMEGRPLNTSLIGSSCFADIQPSLWSVDEAIKTIAANWNHYKLAAN